jgi:hypothetical protein
VSLVYMLLMLGLGMKPDVGMMLLKADIRPEI